MIHFIKDPQATLDYKFDWAPLANGYPNARGNWLADGETITDHAITAVPDGLTIESSQLTNGSTAVAVWISGGAAGTDYAITCHIQTSGGRADDRTANMAIRQR